MIVSGKGGCGMYRKVILASIILIFTLMFSGCYTQLKLVEHDRSATEEYYVEEDSIDSNEVVEEHYHYYFYDPYYFDYGFWNPWWNPYRWRLFVHLGFGYWWYSPFYSPYISVIPWWYPFYYNDPFFGYGGFGFVGRLRPFVKRSFDRRSPYIVRRTIRQDGKRDANQNVRSVVRGGEDGKAVISKKPGKRNQQSLGKRRGKVRHVVKRPSSNPRVRRVKDSGKARRVIRKNPGVKVKSRKDHKLKRFSRVRSGYSRGFNYARFVNRGIKHIPGTSSSRVRVAHSASNRRSDKR